MTSWGSFPNQQVTEQISCSMADQDKSNNLFDGSGLMDRTQIYAQRKSAGQSARRVHSRNFDPAGKRYIIPQYGKRAARRKEAAAYIRDTLITIILVGIIITLLRTFVITQYIIPSSSMEDTLPVGSQVLANKLMRGEPSLKRGHIIVFKDTHGWLSSSESSSTQGGLAGLFNKITGNKNGDRYLIKRIIGLPGDTVACEGAGHPITVNGQPINESSYLKPGTDPSDVAFTVRVTAGNIFVMGDNRSNSADSRYHTDDGNNGLVPMSAVTGVAVAVIWPVSQWRGLTGGTKVFDNVPIPYNS